MHQDGPQGFCLCPGTKGDGNTVDEPLRIGKVAGALLGKPQHVNLNQTWLSALTYTPPARPLTAPYASKPSARGTITTVGTTRLLSTLCATTPHPPAVVSSQCCRVCCYPAHKEDWTTPEPEGRPTWLCPNRPCLVRQGNAWVGGLDLTPNALNPATSRQPA